MAAANKKWIYLILLALIWGSSFILIKKGLIGLTPIQLGALRIVVSGLVLLVFGFKRLKPITKIQWKWIAVSSIFGSFIPVFLFSVAQTQIDSVITSILNSLVPLNTVLIGMLVFNISSTKRQILGVIIGFIGTVLLIVKGAELNPSQNYFYAAFVLISGIMYATNVNLIKKHLHGINPISLTLGHYMIVFVPALIILLFSGIFSSETSQNPEYLSSIGYVVLLAVFCTALAKILFNTLVQIVTPVFASSVTYLMPIVALAWGLLDGEIFSTLQGVATLIILTGIYLANKKKT